MDNINITKDQNDVGITIEAMFKGMDGLLNAKTVVGEELHVGNMTILPIIEVTAGMATGTFGKNADENGAGAMAAKMTPVALFIIQDGRTHLVNIRNQDAVTKAVDTVSDLIPQIVEKFSFRKGKSEDVKKAREAVDSVYGK